MKLREIKEILNASVLTGDENLDIEVFSACGSDLMSDVLAFVKDQALLLTGLVNGQVIRTAEMMDIHAVIFVRGKEPTPDVISLAELRDIVIMKTDMPMYPACGKLYSAGLAGGSVKA